MKNSTNAMRVATVYILAKNEIDNIGRCLSSLAATGLATVLLDSGSTDGTIETAGGFPNVRVEAFRYRDHCESYNELTRRHHADEIVIVIDADMRFEPALVEEMERRFTEDTSLEAAIAPVAMYWGGFPVERSSLYPPKAIGFRGGKAYFEPIGHGEHLRSDVKAVVLNERLVHDDRKPIAQALMNQARYAEQLVRRADAGQANWRDRMRVRTPLFLLVSPLYAYVLRRGFLDGRAGLLYAIDRLLAETLLYRAAVVSRMRGVGGGEEAGSKTGAG